ncbi:MAG: sugar ABC transporter permease [Henriciella sp.]|nr:sugar ABC transporter permease [Henriciella sp.]
MSRFWISLRSFILIVSLLAVLSGGAAYAQSVEASSAEDLTDYRRTGLELSLSGLQEGWSVEIRTDQHGVHTRIPVKDVFGLTRLPAEAALQACFSDGAPVHVDTDQQSVIGAGTQSLRCALTGLRPGTDVAVQAAIVDETGTLRAQSSEIRLRTDVSDLRLTPPDTRPILYLLGSILISLVLLLSALRWWDIRRGNLKSRNAYLYVGPAIVALVLLTFYPITYGIWLSFTDANQTHLGQSSFIGLENFGTVLMSSGLVQVGLFTLIWTVVNVFLHVTLGLLLALVLNRETLFGRNVYRTILLLPWAVPAYISVLAWQGMLQPEGLVNQFLGAEANFLGEATSARISVTLVNAWLGVPFMMMSLSGAMKAISTDMFEAADLDGVSRWNQFRHITFPNLKTTLVPLSLLSFIWTFNMFNTIYLLTRGGPYLGFGQPGATDIMVTYIYDVAFEYGDYGLAAAWSVIVFLLLVSFSIFYVRQTRATEAVT